jgi:hypothetical protein
MPCGLQTQDLTLLLWKFVMQMIEMALAQAATQGAAR